MKSLIKCVFIVFLFVTYTLQAENIEGKFISSPPSEENDEYLKSTGTVSRKMVYIYKEGVVKQFNCAKYFIFYPTLNTYKEEWAEWSPKTNEVYKAGMNIYDYTLKTSRIAETFDNLDALIDYLLVNKLYTELYYQCIQNRVYYSINSTEIDKQPIEIVGNGFNYKYWQDNLSHNYFIIQGDSLQIGPQHSYNLPKPSINNSQSIFVSYFKRLK
jgi:hypothetical protein